MTKTITLEEFNDANMNSFLIKHNKEIEKIYRSYKKLVNDFNEFVKDRYADGALDVLSKIMDKLNYDMDYTATLMDSCTSKIASTEYHGPLDNYGENEVPPLEILSAEHEQFNSYKKQVSHPLNRLLRKICKIQSKQLDLHGKIKQTIKSMSAEYSVCSYNQNDAKEIQSRLAQLIVKGDKWN